jgi:HK97 family phage major capsid protein
MSSTLDRQRQYLAETNQSIRNISDKASTEGRKSLLASEEREYTKLAGLRAQIEERVAQLADEDSRRAAAGAAAVMLGQAGPAGPDGTSFGFGNGADTVYSRTSGFSYFKDLMASATPGDPAAYEAVQRLQEHAQCIDRAAADLPREFRAGPGRRAAGSETRVNPNRTDGQGGYFVPPLWIVDEWVALLRAGRATAERCNVKPLPPGTDSINLPKIATGTSTATQLDNGTVSSTDFTDTFVTGPVRTIAGQQDVAMQLLEQSPAGIDEILFGDLIGDYNQKLDLQVLSGSGTSGQLKGIFNAGPTAVTFTDATPTVPKLYAPLTQALSQVAKARFQPVDTIVMHPSRWYWIVAALDTQNRPLVTPEGANGANTIAVLDATAVEGVAGSLAGVPIVVDANMPINGGAGTNQDTILAGKMKDCYLYEGALRTRALVEVLSGTLQVRLQVYNYVAQIPDRYPVAYATITGTGLIVPAGY